jgi:hypothetical protein
MALLAARDAICDAGVALLMHMPVSTSLLATVRAGLSRFPVGCRPGDLSASLAEAELVSRAETVFDTASAFPAIEQVLHPSPAGTTIGRGKRLRYRPTPYARKQQLRSAVRAIRLTQTP